MTRLIILATLATTACAPGQPMANDSTTVLPPTTAVPRMPAVDEVTTLEGEWRVAGIDQPEGLALSASREEIWWAPRCAGYARTYRIDGASFRTGPHIGFVERKPGDPTPPVCAIAPPPRIGEVFRALTSATTIRRTANNGIEISGGGHSLLLFSQ